MNRPTTGRHSWQRWAVFAVVTILVSVVGAFGTMAIMATATLGTASCRPEDTSGPCSDVWPTLLTIGWIAAVVSAVVGAVVGARTHRSLWIGYPISAGVYFVCAMFALGIASS